VRAQKVRYSMRIASTSVRTAIRFGCLLVAELKARGLPWVMNSIETPRITDQLYLPPWQPLLSNYLWPPRK
jgi:hypothetical protein